MKRETERLQRELEQREMEEALALVKASKGGKGVKLKVRVHTPYRQGLLASSHYLRSSALPALIGQHNVVFTLDILL